MKPLLTILCAVLALGIFSGCQDTVNTARNADMQMQPELVDIQYFSTDSFCRNRFKLLRIDRVETPGGMLKIQATVQSARYGFWAELWSGITGENPYHVSYKFDWMDEAGMQVNSVTSVWINEIFLPGEIKTLQSAAPNARCKDFRLSMKEAE